MKLVAVAFFTTFFIAQDKASALVITSFSYCKSILAIDLIINGPQSVNASSGDPVDFNCTATATLISWRINGETGAESSNGFQELPPIVLDKSQNLIMERLKVLASTMVDNTTLTCVAFLEISPGMYGDSDNKSALLLVQGAILLYTSVWHPCCNFVFIGPLESVSDLTVVSINSTTVLISWSPPFTLEGVPILGYNVTITNTTSEEELEIENTTMLNYTFSIDDPDLDSDFTVTVVPINGAGPGENVSIKFIFSLGGFNFTELA